MLIKDKVTGAEVTFTIPTPNTSPVFSGELPFNKSPCEEVSANDAPFVALEDCVAIHQFITNLPGSWKVTIPNAGS